MLVAREILIASDRRGFVEALAEALNDEGALVACIDEFDAVHAALRAGFRPDAVLLDGTLPEVPKFAAALREVPRLAATPVLAASPAVISHELANVRVIRRDVHEVVRALSDACDAATTHQ